MFEKASYCIKSIGIKENLNSFNFLGKIKILNIFGWQWEKIYYL